MGHISISDLTVLIERIMRATKLLVLIVTITIVAAPANGQTADVTQLLQQLQSSDPAVRSAAFYALDPIGYSSSDQIKVATISLLATEIAFENGLETVGVLPPDGWDDYYSEVVAVVASFGDMRAVNALVGVIDTGTIATNGLARIGAAAVDPVASVLSTGDEAKRVGAAIVFGAMLQSSGSTLVGDQTVRDKITAALVSASNDSSPLVRVSVTTAITQLQGVSNAPVAGIVLVPSSLSQVYDGTPKTVTVATVPLGLAVTVMYNGYPTARSGVGSYSILATILDPHYQGSASGTLTIQKATPLISWPKPANTSFGSALGNGQLNATANVPGTFAYSPPAGTVLGVGNGQILSVSFTPKDTANYNTASAQTLINVLPGTASGVQIIVTNVLKRDANNNIVVQLTLANAGLTAASKVALTSVKISTVSGTPLPQTIGTIGANSLAQATVTVPGSAGATGAAGSLAVTGTYTGGTFSVTSRITLP